MELRDFIKTALVDLITGVQEAKSELGKQGNLICVVAGPHEAKEHKLHDSRGYYHQKIEFDVAVTAGDETSISGKADGKIGIKVLNASASADGKFSSNN